MNISYIYMQRNLQISRINTQVMSDCLRFLGCLVLLVVLANGLERSNCIRCKNGGIPDRTNIFSRCVCKCRTVSFNLESILVTNRILDNAEISIVILQLHIRV